MKLLRPIIVVLVGAISMLLIVQTAAADSQGKGGKGASAAVGIDSILLIDTPPQGGVILAQISGGGFLGGTDPVEVILDDSPPALVLVGGVTAGMLVATIPAGTALGDHKITVTTGDDKKENASATIRLGGEMIVRCISWFKSGPEDEHVHTEVHIEDENGAPVIGATVEWEAENPSFVVYQTNISLTHPNDGHASGENCTNGDVSGSGVTDWFCCIGAGDFDKDGPPGKRACEGGTYTARIISVDSPLFRNMVWDETNDENQFEATIDLVDPKFP